MIILRRVIILVEQKHSAPKACHSFREGAKLLDPDIPAVRLGSGTINKLFLINLSTPPEQFVRDALSKKMR